MTQADSVLSTPRMNTSAITPTNAPLAGPAQAIRTRKSRRPRSVRPRFKKPQAAETAIIAMGSVGGGDNSEHYPDRRPWIPAEGHPLHEIASLRQKAVEAIELLLGLLDATDGDCDREEQGGEPTDDEIAQLGPNWTLPLDEDEPSLCGITASPVPAIAEHFIDGEQDDADADDDTISEPTLGWPERDSQRIWPDAGGDFSDRQTAELI